MRFSPKMQSQDIVGVFEFYSTYTTWGGQARRQARKNTRKKPSGQKAAWLFHKLVREVGLEPSVRYGNVQLQRRFAVNLLF